jgi:drug/metabolite transporter (DMT)-like permease
VNPRWLKPGDWLAGTGGVALLVSLFLPWYRVTGDEGDLSGWEAFSIIDVLLALAALVGIGLAVLTAIRRTPAVPVALGVLGGPIGLLAALIVLIRIVDPPGPNDLLGPALGAWLSLAGALAVGAGAWMSLRDERNRGVPPVPVEVRPAPPAT